MTGSQEMLEAARRGARQLGPTRGRVLDFVQSHLDPDGGFRGRGPAADLYYTVFGIDCLLALDEPAAWHRSPDYLTSFGRGEDLDFMHLVSLARCHARWSTVPGSGDPFGTAQWLARLSAYGCPDGGFNTVAGTSHGSVTGNVLAWLTHEDVGTSLPCPDIVLSLAGLRSADGGYANLPRLPAGTTTATAGALMLLHWMGQPVDLSAAQWLLDQYATDGGFLATPGAPIPDLLSTATSVFALHSLGLDTSELASSCLAFVSSLQHQDGGYRGYSLDSMSDCEYTFYALMAMGCLTAE